MARQNPRPAGPADELGLLIGKAISEGLVEGLRRSFDAVRNELLPLHDEVLEGLRKELEAHLSVAKEEAEEFASLTRPCEDPSCERQAVARGLCRRHYARLTYRERRERQGAVVTPRAERRVPSRGKVKKKPVAAIAPIVRRKKDADEQAPVAETAAPVAKTDTVSVDSVARFFGVK